MRPDKLGQVRPCGHVSMRCAWLPAVWSTVQHLNAWAVCQSWSFIYSRMMSVPRFVPGLIRGIVSIFSQMEYCVCAVSTFPSIVCFSTSMLFCSLWSFLFLSWLFHEHLMWLSALPSGQYYWQECTFGAPLWVQMGDLDVIVGVHCTALTILHALLYSSPARHCHVHCTEGVFSPGPRREPSKSMQGVSGKHVCRQWVPFQELELSCSTTERLADTQPIQHGGSLQEHGCVLAWQGCKCCIVRLWPDWPSWTVLQLQLIQFWWSLSMKTQNFIWISHVLETSNASCENARVLVSQCCAIMYRTWWSPTQNTFKPIITWCWRHSYVGISDAASQLPRKKRMKPHSVVP